MSFEVWRQDDNGNRFLVASHPGRAAAELQVAELTGFPHKQFYWIIEKTDDRLEKPEETK